jgi:hypothetical protein
MYISAQMVKKFRPFRGPECSLPWRMASSWMLCRVALVRTDSSEELSASFIRVTRIGELGTTLKNGVFWDVTPCGSCKNRRNIPEDTILHSHGRENLKYYALCFVYKTRHFIL